MKLYCLVSGSLVLSEDWGWWPEDTDPDVLRLLQSVGQQKPSWWYDMISYRGGRISHLNPCWDTNKMHQIGLLLNLMSANMLEIWHWLSLTHFLQILQGAMCDNVDKPWNREPKPLVLTNEHSVSLPINQSEFDFLTQSQLGTLEDLSAEDDALSLSLTTWILWIHYSQPRPTLINTSSLSLINNYAVRSLITASLWKLVETFDF